MKTVRFSMADEPPSFGVVISDHAIAFASLQQRSGMLIIKRLGSLQCTLAKPTQKLLPSRWPLRPALEGFAAE